jgi:hypothetical protein
MLGFVDTFFGLHFVSSKDDCITIDQMTKTEIIITDSFGPSWQSQPPSSSGSIHMKTGTAYAESLAGGALFPWMKLVLHRSKPSLVLSFVITSSVVCISLFGHD